ncbi:MAG: ParB/RepB/Spo0J family partition protein [Deltaproteobacteria bacterium]|nr:ParB/RepB/Spo0J family partition protein [Deltaproteobacteria bacterium]
MWVNARSVPLARLFLGDAVYRITTPAALDKLTGSIAALGVLGPPILRTKADGYQIVAGFRRIEACRLLGRSEIPARVLPEDSDHRTCVRLAIADNSLQRPLNLIETARALNLLAGIAVDDKELSREAAGLALPENPALIRKIMSLTTLPEGLQDRLAAGDLSLAMALELKRFDGRTAESLGRLFTDLKLGLNRQREVLSLLTEIARREETTVAELLDEPALQSLLRSPDLERIQKAGQLRSRLRRRRYPALSAATARFQELVRHLNLGPGVALIPPDNFEGTTYTLAITFDRLDQLGDRRLQIEILLRNPTLRDFLEK